MFCVAFQVCSVPSLTTTTTIKAVERLFDDDTPTHTQKTDLITVHRTERVLVSNDDTTATLLLGVVPCSDWRCTTRGAPPILGPRGSPKSPPNILLTPQSWSEVWGNGTERPRLVQTHSVGVPETLKTQRCTCSSIFSSGPHTAHISSRHRMSND